MSNTNFLSKNGKNKDAPRLTVGEEEERQKDYLLK